MLFHPPQNANNSQKICLDKYQVNQIIAAPNYLIENNEFICEEFKLFE